MSSQSVWTLGKRPGTVPASLYCREDEKHFRSNYGYMNEWIKLRNQGIQFPRIGEVFPTLQCANHPPIGVKPTYDANERVGRAGHGEPSSFVQPVNEDKFLKMYRDLTDQIAYRYPNPGHAKTRTGRMGSSWRHVKQVTQHIGTPILFLDGLVRQYDRDGLNSHLNSCGESRSHVSTPRYCPNKHDLQPTSRDRSFMEDLRTGQNASDCARMPAPIRSLGEEPRVGPHKNPHQTLCFQ